MSDTYLNSIIWIIYTRGLPIQHLKKPPLLQQARQAQHGEPFVNQRVTGLAYDERFTFTGKERDAETGYSYFGARYYDSGLPNIFLSVDPMSDKYPNISPYAYCAWNPVKLVDPDGMEIDWVKNNKTGQYEWSDKATSPDNTPDGYRYIGDDKSLLDDLNIRTDYETKEDCKNGYSSDMSSTHAGFVRSRNCNDATIRVGVSAKIDKKNITSDNSNGITFNGIIITGYVNQWSKTAGGETNTIIYNGILEVTGTNNFREQSSFSRLSEACISSAGTIPMQTSIHISANDAYKNIMSSAKIKLGHASASMFNGTKTFSWSLLQRTVVH